MAFDYKKEEKEYYPKKEKITIVKVKKMNFLAVFGEGDPNEPDGEYKKSIELLYPVAYTLRMSYKTDYKIENFFEYVVPPLEGFWWQDGIKGVDLNNKQKFKFISLLRLPDFITKKDYEWAIKKVTIKKKQDFSKVKFFTYEEGLCVQSLHIGPYDEEFKTVEKMHKYLEENNCQLDINDKRYHHEIYLSNPLKTKPEKLKTIIRHPIKKGAKNEKNN